MIASWIVCLTLACAGGPRGFDTTFTGATLRFDYAHSGTASQEHVSLEGIRLEGPWPGSRSRLLDDTNLGKYLFRVIDLATNRTLYSRGFSSIYGEWETTGEARRGVWRTFDESQRFPEPRSRFQIVLAKRGDDGAFREFYSRVVDPAGRMVDRSPLPGADAGGGRRGAWTLLDSGPIERKVDLLVLGEGYTAEQGEKFRKDVERLTGVLFDTEPFRSRHADFNVRAIQVPSARPGVSNPRKGEWNATPLGLRFNALDSDRYLLTFENRAVREVAAAVPYDTMILLANTRKYGGGGIFNLYATCASDTEPAAYVFVHEFGHAFAGLADEYYTSQVSYEEFVPPGVEPWEPNITASADLQGLKWKDLVEPGTPIPTPWDQESYDKASNEYQKKRWKLRDEGAPEEEVEKLFREIKAITAPLLAGQKYAGRVGAFVGAGYQAKGLFRPEVDCIMFTRNPKEFCAVCRGAIDRVIDLYTR